MFRVSKLENVVESSESKPEEYAEQLETETAATEATSTD